jgi:hypothetical protein
MRGAAAKKVSVAARPEISEVLGQGRTPPMSAVIVAVNHEPGGHQAFD